jgi:hypothetical protein
VPEIIPTPTGPENVNPANVTMFVGIAEPLSADDKVNVVVPFVAMM